MKGMKRMMLSLSRIKHIACMLVLAAAFAGSHGCSCGDDNGGPCADNRGPECCLEDQDCGESIFCCTINTIISILPRRIC